MSWIPTVKMFKGNRQIKVNADDTIRYAKEGWMREEDYLKEQRQDSESKEVTNEDTEPVEDQNIQTLDDLQVD